MPQDATTEANLAAWAENAARHLVDTSRCPRCGAALSGAGSCAACGAQLTGEPATAVWQASVRAADAIRERQRLIAQMAVGPVAPTVAGPVTPTDALPGSVAIGPAPAASAPAASASAASASAASEPVPGDGPTSGFSVQSLLAVAGAGLFAIAAVVFTFLNPDLTDLTTRTVIVGVIAIVFLVGGWLLHRGSLRFSGEAVGALGAVFTGLTAASLSSAPGVLDFWTGLGIATLVAGAGLLVLGRLTRIRSWLWSATVALTCVPAFLGFGGGSVASSVIGALGAVGAGIVVQETLRPLRNRFASALNAEAIATSVLQIAAAALVPALLPFVAVPDDGQRALVASAALLVLAVLAVAATRTRLAGFWSVTAGVSAAFGFGLLPVAVDAIDPVWHLALLPAIVGAVTVALGALRRTGSVRSAPLVYGSLTVLVAAVTPAIALALLQLLLPLGRLLAGSRAVFDSRPESGLAPLLGVVAFAASMAGLAVQRHRYGGRVGTPFVGLSLWALALAALALAPWDAVPHPFQIVLALAVATGAALACALPAARRLGAVALAPAATAAHVGVIVAALVSWEREPLGAVFAGAPVLLVLALVARTVSPAGRALHVGAGYAYALLLVGTALAEAGFEPIAVLSLTVSVASVAALAATLAPAVEARAWYAVLVVTAVPFLLGVASVLIERTGWTALATALTFALALTLVLTRRPGLNRLVRSAAAGLLVPSLAVVAVCLGAWLLASSGSPVVLPVIAVIVAVTLASLRLARELLERRGIGDPSAVSAVALIELSTLVTAAITVLLALVRVAAGLETAVVVLLILGIGGAAARLYAGRPYGWWLAGAAWTGALWSVWALVGVDLVEAFTLPPALAVAVVGAALMLRGRDGTPLVASGLAVSVLPSIVLVVAAGAGDGFPWRAVALLVVAAVLVALAAGIPDRGPLSRFTPVRGPLLALGVAAALAGPAQAVRYGLALDPVTVDDGVLMMVALGFGVVAGAIALAAGLRAFALLSVAVGSAPGRLERMLRRPGAARLFAVPALVYLVVGPIASIRQDWLSIWTLWLLMLVLLGLMLALVARRGERVGIRPPVWLVYAAAWFTGVAGWSERELRVEWFSLPLGLAVLLAGIVEWRLARWQRDPAQRRRASWNDWPHGFGGSWRLLGPGIGLTLLPSILATGTDPLTARAILVIAIALVAILVGSSRRLAAPFVLGLLALPIENIVVFVVQIGDEIGALPWWITLATAGAVLLALAVGSERKTAQGGGVAARLRELR